MLIHDYGLPWLHHSDQASLWLTVQWQRGLLPQEVAKSGINYPPLFLWLHHLAQPLAEAQGRALAADVILDLRRLILLANVAGTAPAALLGRRCGGALAGILAALLWAFTPIMLDVPIHAIGESLAYPLLILSLLLAVQALEPARRWQLAQASLALATLCFLLEYRLLVAFFPGRSGAAPAGQGALPAGLATHVAVGQRRRRAGTRGGRHPAHLAASALSGSCCADPGRIPVGPAWSGAAF